MLKKAVLFFSLFLFIQVSCRADGYWLECEGSGRVGDSLVIRIRYGGVNDDKIRYIKTGPDLNKMAGYSLLVVQPDGKQCPILLQQQMDSWIGYYIPQQEGIYQVLAKNESLPVVERADPALNIRPIQYLCSVYTVNGNSKGRFRFPYLHIETEVEHDFAVVKPYLEGRPLAVGTSIRIFLPDNHDVNLKVDDEGRAWLPITTPGRYLIRLDQLVSKPGQFEGRKFRHLRYRCDYTLVIR